MRLKTGAASVDGFVGTEVANALKETPRFLNSRTTLSYQDRQRPDECGLADQEAAAGDLPGKLHLPPSARLNFFLNVRLNFRTIVLSYELDGLKEVGMASALAMKETRSV